MTDAGRGSRIVGSVQFPQGKMRLFRHTFRLQIPQKSSALSQLSINVPDGLPVRNNISVTDQSGLKIDTNVSVNGRKLIIAFPKPVAFGTRLNIAMKNIIRLGSSNAWLYRVSAKLVGIAAYLPIGIARFRVY